MGAVTFTGQPGVAGQVVPGYFYTGQAVWRGPFPVQTGAPLPSGTWAPGATLPVSTALEGSLAASDPTWWELH